MIFWEIPAVICPAFDLWQLPPSHMLLLHAVRTCVCVCVCGTFELRGLIASLACVCVRARVMARRRYKSGTASEWATGDPEASSRQVSFHRARRSGIREIHFVHLLLFFLLFSVNEMFHEIKKLEMFSSRRFRLTWVELQEDDVTVASFLKRHVKMLLFFKRFATEV